jgi:deoxyribodipyrimidine photolyase
MLPRAVSTAPPHNNTQLTVKLHVLLSSCRYLAFHFPFITERSMLAHLRAVPWRLDQDAFKAWRQGLTGYPLVDAGRGRC